MPFQKLSAYFMKSLEQILNEIKNDLDRVDKMLSETAEGLESIDMSLRFIKIELDHDLRGGSSAG